VVLQYCLRSLVFGMFPDPDEQAQAKPKFPFRVKAWIARRRVYRPGEEKRVGAKSLHYFRIGDYSSRTPKILGVDSLVVGFNRGKDLIYAARVRAGLVPVTRQHIGWNHTLPYVSYRPGSDCCSLRMATCLKFRPAS
jgi:hypothetical protein